MTPFQPANLPPEAFQYERYMGPPFNLKKRDAKRVVQANKAEKVFKNDLYQVNVNHIPAGSFPALIWLSIKRIDREPIHDWRDLQAIKNLIVGPEHEAVELYPAESRLVDTANQYHLYVLADTAHRFPFGFRDRLVHGSDRAAELGAKQRELTDSELQTGALTEVASNHAASAIAEASDAINGDTE